MWWCGHFLKLRMPTPEQSHTHYLCNRVAGCVSQDFNMTLSEPQDYEFLFGKLAELLSFTQKGAAPKMMRWFSCNELWHIRSSEFWSLKMLLQHHLGGNRANDDWESMRDPAEMMQAPPSMTKSPSHTLCNAPPHLCTNTNPSRSVPRVGCQINS